MARKKRGKGFSLAVFAVLVILGLAGLYWFRTLPPPAPKPVLVHPAADALAVRTAVKACLKQLGVTPALMRKETAEDGLSVMAFRLPRCLDAGGVRQALDEAARSQGGSVKEGSSVPEAPNVRGWEWNVFAGPEKIMRLEAEKSSFPGYNTRELGLFLDLPPQVSLAIFPFEAKSRQIAEKAAAAGHEVVLHLPMEPHAAMPLVEGTLRESFSDIQIRQDLKDELEALPQAAGVNNHEGSKGTEDSRLIGLVLEALKQRDMYFLDSRTSAKSVVSSLARARGVRQASRRVFLDNEDYIDSIQEAARKAARIAIKTGSCVAIGHGRANTLKVIASLVPEWREQGIELVPVSELVK
jgi:polysaccharide deacetylase 2 family uncharacterized protein YibQ